MRQLPEITLCHQAMGMWWPAACVNQTTLHHSDTPTPYDPRVMVLLQVFCTSLLKAPVNGLVIHDHGSSSYHLFPCFLSALADLAAVHAQHPNAGLGPLLVAHQCLPQTSAMMMSGYYTLPQVG